MSSAQFNNPPYAQTPESCGNSISEESCVYSRSTSVSEPDDSYICTKQRELFQKWRPTIHLIAPTGWLNDPCAPGYDHINDCYHIGFQWNPESAEWGNICWGAATSRDLLSWDISREPSIVPSKEEGEGGVFTGCLSPVELHPGKLTAFYTSAKILPIHHTLPYTHGSEGLHLATSSNSGKTWTRYEANPVLPGPPSDLKVTGWRDPFVSVWPSLARTLGDPDNTLYGIVSGGLLGQGPTPFIYRLDEGDITNWEFLSPLVSLPPNHSPSPSWPTDNGVNWEVTNFLSLEDPDDTRTHDFLIMGVEGRLPQEWNKGRSAFSVDHGQLWMCGKLQADDGKPTMDYTYGGCLDHGSYYAGNSFWDPKTQQQIIIGWIIEEDLPVELRKHQGWAGLLSLPRALKLQRLRGVSRALVTPLEQIPSILLRQDGIRGNEPTYEVTTLCAVPDDRLSRLRGVWWWTLRVSPVKCRNIGDEMKLGKDRNGPQALLAAALGAVMLDPVAAVSCSPYTPFEPIDPQNWANPDNMTWDDWVKPPGTDWSNPARKGSSRNFNIALVVVDYPDRNFTISQPAHSTIFNNPQPAAADIPREKVPNFYRDLLNTPNELNQGHTLHEYWMEDSAGRFGVDLTSFGAYQLPRNGYQYGVSDDMNPGACPIGETCDLDIRTDALSAWRNDVGNATADAFELVFILSAGQDESSTWQEFGEMKFDGPDDVPDEFGPPKTDNTSLPNWAATRYVPWTSWAAASTLWPNAGGGSSTQGESSGMAVYAHELSHLLDIGDNYNNPYGTPLRRAYTGIWSMMSRGSFNGPGGPHTRWQIPAVQGASMGSLHTLRDKFQLGLIERSDILWLSREALATSGVAVAQLTARSVDPGDGLMGIRIMMDADRSPACDINTEPLCDGGSWDNYDIEVVDRMGSDSFTPDSGVLISKSKNVDRQPFQWVIDAHPEDIELVDFYRPNGSVAMITMGDYRQLADALFHAGTNSGSEFEFIDEANDLHFYIIDRHRNDDGILSYTVAVRSIGGEGGASLHDVSLEDGLVTDLKQNAPTGQGVTCSFQLTNRGSYVAIDPNEAQHPEDVSAFLESDVYRLSAEVDGAGWRIEVPNALLTAKFGEVKTARVSVGASAEAADSAVVTLKVTSESDPSVVASAQCNVVKS
ncbi:hypothetical protein CkaCkLH20_04453 [Colletotrichum karsti]|uniref:Glycosyl hydrolase family 32 N-terminal domain-containing protein n=1 Tax=Colletotrichum karsti TaxID=1095194 RepID=A0A9P6LMU5_9PEZI|nr:uncharacterized protein CkaCkLH20_04453 [Colletotrichum karsti]KAF9877877.1 hypothetical protein CkaCkLH20_04453 [Colletotrichum karsti]